MQESFFTRWSKRTWFTAAWTAAILAVVVFVEISIAGSEDAFNFNAMFEFLAFLSGLIIWGVGCGVIALVAGLVDRHRQKPLSMAREKMDTKL